MTTRTLTDPAHFRSREDWLAFWERVTRATPLERPGFWKRVGLPLVGSGKAEGRIVKPKEAE